MKSIFLTLFCFVLLSCGKGTPYKSAEISNESFNSLINAYSINEGKNQTIDRTLYNDDAKVYISLYSDGHFFYEVPGVGRGIGDWTRQKYSLKLIADVGIFDMKINIKTKDNKKFEFHYMDRFGFNVVDATFKNIN